MKKIIQLFAIFIGCCLISATATAMHSGDKEFTLAGVMKHTEIEGGCWFLETKQGNYELTGTPALMQTCKVVGRPLTLRVRQAGMMASVCMIGKMVEVLEVLDSVYHPHNPPVDLMMIKGTVHRLRNGCWYVLTSAKKKYEMQDPIPKQFMKIGKKYARTSKVIPGIEGKCSMTGVILFTMSEPDLNIIQKPADPR